MNVTDEDRAFFADKKTTLADIQAAGWHKYFSSSGRWWFDRDMDRGMDRVPDHFFLPQWVHEIEAAAEKRGIAEIRAQLRSALGIGAKEREAKT